MRFFWIILIIPVFMLASCGGVTKILRSKDYQYKLRMAEKYYAKKKYNSAQQLYENVMPFVKGTPEFEDVVYKYAYCYYYMRDYLAAEQYFKNFIELFPNSSRAEEVDYMQAYSFYKQSPKPELDQTNTQRAIGQMQVFINTHPGSPRIKEANEIIDLCRNKLEIKEFRNAEHYNLGQYRAAAVAFTSLLNNYPESNRGDEYKILAIKSYYQFANLSIEEKKLARFEQVITECREFADRFPDSKLMKEVERYQNLSDNNIKALKNEQAKKTTGS
jgi:outer membrane protein assembly factor BamD